MSGTIRYLILLKCLWSSHLLKHIFLPMILKRTSVKCLGVKRLSKEMRTHICTCVSVSCHALLDVQYICAKVKQVPYVSVAAGVPGLYGYLTNTRGEWTSASVSLKPSKYFIQAFAQTLTKNMWMSQLRWSGVLSSLQLICKKSSILYVCSASLRSWVASYFHPAFYIFNANTYNKLSPKANYSMIPLKTGLRYDSKTSATFSGSHFWLTFIPLFTEEQPWCVDVLMCWCLWLTLVIKHKGI